jgi:hypothetical protein
MTHLKSQLSTRIATATRSLSTAGLTHVRRNEYDAIGKVQRFAGLLVVRVAEWNDVPASITQTVLLHMCSYGGLRSASFLGTIGGDCASAEVLPMGKPTNALAGIVAGAVNVIYLHSLTSFICLHSNKNLSRNRRIPNSATDPMIHNPTCPARYTSAGCA